jgi:hypothetical protein
MINFGKSSTGFFSVMYIVGMLDEIFCRYQLGPFDLCCDLVLEFLYWVFVWMTCLLVKGCIKVSHYMWESVCAFKCFSVCLMKFGTLTLGAYRLIILISFWCISPFISMKCSSLSHLMNVSLKSTLSDISIATSACFQGPSAW